MKNKCTFKLASALLLLTTLISQPTTSLAQGTAFTYQGQLNLSGSPVNGSYDIGFFVCSGASGNNVISGVITNFATPVSNGLFTVTLDFGPGIFTGDDRWLGIGVRLSGNGTFTILTPRQQITATPYAAYAGVANSFSGNGVNVTNVNAAKLSGLDSTNFWKLSGNNVGPNQFLGSTNNQALQFMAGGQRALRLESNSGLGRSGAPNVIGGSSVNFVSPNTFGATISGGGVTNLNGTAYSNSVAADFSTIGGGDENEIQNSAFASTIGGGEANQIQISSLSATIAGGDGNTIQGSASYATVGGGIGNMILTNGVNAVIPGGSFNTATSYAFAAGNNAQAIHNGAFVWSDSVGTATSSAANDSVTMRARGGYRLFTAAGNVGASLDANATAWAVISDRNVKKDFAAVDSVGILEKLAAIPITQWRYEWETADITPHIGPMAQDFKHAFYPGRDDKSITTLETDGVTLAAIQGLNQKVEEQRAENAALKRELVELKELVVKLANSKDGGAE